MSIAHNPWYATLHCLSGVRPHVECSRTRIDIESFTVADVLWGHNWCICLHATKYDTHTRMMYGWDTQIQNSHKVQTVEWMWWAEIRHAHFDGTGHNEMYHITSPMRFVWLADICREQAGARKYMKCAHIVLFGLRVAGKCTTSNTTRWKCLWFVWSHSPL